MIHLVCKVSIQQYYFQSFPTWFEMLKIPEIILRNCTHKSLDYNILEAQPELQINNYTWSKLLIWKQVWNYCWDVFVFEMSLSNLSAVSQQFLSGFSVVSQWSLSGFLAVSQQSLSGFSTNPLRYLSGLSAVSQRFLSGFGIWIGLWPRACQ